MRSPENEAVALAMWEAYDSEGLAGILRWATDDANWLPHSAGGRMFASTAAYREHLEEELTRGVRVDSIRHGLWSHGDVVVVRGRLRMSQGAVRQDSRMYWVHRVRDGKVCWTGSAPDLGGLLGQVGLGDRSFANEALVGLH